MQNVQLSYMAAADELIRGAKELGGGAESNIFVVAQRERWPENSMGFVNEQNQAAIQISEKFNRIYSTILGKDFDAKTASVEDVKKIRDNVLIDGKPIDFEPYEANCHAVLGVISMAVVKELAGVQNMKTNGALARNEPVKPVNFTIADSKEPLFVDMRSYARETSEFVKPRKPSKPNIFKRMIHAISDKAFKNDFDRYDRLKSEYDKQMVEYNKRDIYDRMDIASEDRQRRVAVEDRAWNEAQKVESLEQTDNKIEQFMEKAKAAGLDTKGISNKPLFEDNTIIGNMEFDETANEFEQMQESLDNAGKELEDFVEKAKEAGLDTRKASAALDNHADMTIIDFMELQEEEGLSSSNKTTQAVTNDREKEMSMGSKSN